MKDYQNEILEAVKSLPVEKLQPKLIELAKSGEGDYQDDANYLKVCDREPGFHEALLKAVEDSGLENSPQEFMEKVGYLSGVGLDVKNETIHKMVKKHSAGVSSEVKQALEKAGFDVTHEAKSVLPIKDQATIEASKPGEGEDFSDFEEDEVDQASDTSEQADVDDFIEIKPEDAEGHDESHQSILMRLISKVKGFLDQFLHPKVENQDLKGNAYDQLENSEQAAEAEAEDEDKPEDLGLDATDVDPDAEEITDELDTADVDLDDAKELSDEDIKSHSGDGSTKPKR